MAIRRETLHLLGSIRIAIDDIVDLATDDLVYAWVRAWNELYAEWAATIAELTEMRVKGRWPSRTQVLRAERVAKALFATRQALDSLADNAGVRIVQSLHDLVDAEDYLDLIASQFPDTQAGAQLTAELLRADARQIEAIVRRTSDNIVSQLRPIGMRAEGRMRSVLVRGVATGLHPRRVATLMLRRLEGGFNGGLSRTLVISRTEMLDAHRAAAAATQKANTDVLTGWQWVATLDTKTCPSCWSQHGSMHDLTESGPLDHQQGRCFRLPVTKTWADLGFDIPEPASLVPDAEDVFASLSRAQQLEVMGTQRLELLNSGAIGWDDLSQLRRTSGWRDSFGVTPLRTLER